ncbi:Germin-like protein subfamily 1 member 17 [Striga hermonthica]|uniref:Germin-like protein n=1 Tax=Striga hermonthica TaxID=68872 RepID=A0A9N7QZT3_STRHE|nr:Germin-like protein subfamily 1 member 17 [Striga hermonthica]
MPIINIFFLLLIINIFIFPTIAFDPPPTQDICVADFSKGPKAYDNLPFPCKDPEQATAEDFFSDLLSKAGDTNNAFNASFNSLNTTQIPGRNALGMTVTRLDLGPGGSFPLHIHHRATELFIVFQGELEVGFVTSAQDNYKLYNMTIPEGGVFYVPVGLVHYQRNALKDGNTVAFSVFNRQNPGYDPVAHAAFKSAPLIDSGYLADAFQLDENIIHMLQGKTWV